MMLPKINTPTFRVNVPSLDKEILMRPDPDGPIILVKIPFLIFKFKF